MRGRLRTGVQARNDGDLWKEDKATGDDSGSVVKECADEIPAYGGFLFFKSLWSLYVCHDK
ncbi:hypothetical protein DCAR_0623645 [Daucus carota subsp. sativus]|uniref:Uncharacterized protein n=1 Tax=Daucus carota subsp. sativus TaxID=79200 RepID=A0A161XBZ8_DAUCS|nr:hypothetical protein DCAR_0623645 [Daucus carota subsp. sativus]